MSDFCDGKVYLGHPLFSAHSSALQIFFYYDDLEICNPLGSKAKVHKLSEYRYTVVNSDHYVYSVDGVLYIECTYSETRSYGHLNSEMTYIEDHYFWPRCDH